MQIAQKPFIFHVTKWHRSSHFQVRQHHQPHPTRERLLIIIQVHQPATRIPKTNWNTVGNRERRLYHVACNPLSVRLPILCRDYLRRARRPAWQRRRRCHRRRRRRRRRRPRHRCTKRTASTTSCRSTAAWNPLDIDRPASPGIVTSGPRSAADPNAPSARRACKFPARNRPPANGTIPGRGGNRRCRSRRVGRKHLFLNGRAQIEPEVQF